MKTSDIKGIIPPVITPMNNDDEQTVNHEALRQQVERLLAGGVHGMFPLGTNGEAYALSFKEKEEILATVIDQVKGRVPVYAGTGCITTAETIRMSKRAEEMGADALSIITPSFALASQKELYDHYVAVAKQVNIPIILYNIPPRTGNKLLPETVQALCRDVDVIVGPAMGGIVYAYELARQTGKRAIFTERVDNVMTLKRFRINPGERCIIAEDVVTTGVSSLETKRVIEENGGICVGIACVVDRTRAEAPSPIPIVASALKLDLPNYAPEECPICKEGKLPLVHLGSRKMKQEAKQTL